MSPEKFMIYKCIPEKYLVHPEFNDYVSDLYLFRRCLRAMASNFLDKMDEEDNTSEDHRELGITINVVKNFEAHINIILDQVDDLCKHYGYVIPCDIPADVTLYECDVEPAPRIVRWVTTEGAYANDVTVRWVELNHKYDRDLIRPLSVEKRDVAWLTQCGAIERDHAARATY